MMKSTVIKVVFPNGTKTYTYQTLLSLAVGAYVVCDSSTGLGIAKVVQINSTRPTAFELAWVLCSVPAARRRDEIQRYLKDAEKFSVEPKAVKPSHVKDEPPDY